MKKQIKIFLIAILIFITLTPVQAEILKDTGDYCNDSAGILSQQDVDYLSRAGANLDEKTTAQVILVTIKSTDGMEIADYAKKLFNSWGIGDAKKNNGVLILIVPDQKDYWISVGDGIKNIVTDTFLSNLVYDNKFNDMVDNGNEYSKRIRAVYNAITGKLQSYYRSTPPPNNFATSGNTFITKIALSGIWVTVIIIFACSYARYKTAKKKLVGMKIIEEPKVELFPRPVQTIKPTQPVQSQQPVQKTVIIKETDDTPLFSPKPAAPKPSAPKSVTRFSSTSRTSSTRVTRPSSSTSTSSSPKRTNGGGHTSGGGIGRH